MGKDWTALHDFLLIQATQTHGDRWQFISTVVPGRSPAECAERHKELDAKGLGTLETLQAHQASLRSAKPLNPRKEFVPKPSPFPALIEQAKVDKTARKWAQRAASKKTRASVATTSAKRVLLKVGSPLASTQKTS